MYMYMNQRENPPFKHFYRGKGHTVLWGMQKAGQILREHFDLEL